MAIVHFCQTSLVQSMCQRGCRSLAIQDRHIRRETRYRGFYPHPKIELLTWPPPHRVLVMLSSVHMQTQFKASSSTYSNAATVHYPLSFLLYPGGSPHIPPPSYIMVAECSWLHEARQTALLCQIVDQSTADSSAAGSATHLFTSEYHIHTDYRH
jgi:hypothetical protein